MDRGDSGGAWTVECSGDQPGSTLKENIKAYFQQKFSETLQEINTNDWHNHTQ